MLTLDDIFRARCSAAKVCNALVRRLGSMDSKAVWKVLMRHVGYRNSACVIEYFQGQNRLILLLNSIIDALGYKRVSGEGLALADGQYILPPDEDFEMFRCLPTLEDYYATYKKLLQIIKEVRREGRHE